MLVNDWVYIRLTLFNSVTMHALVDYCAQRGVSTRINYTMVLSQTFIAAPQQNIYRNCDSHPTLHTGCIFTII